MQLDRIIRKKDACSETGKWLSRSVEVLFNYFHFFSWKMKFTTLLITTALIGAFLASLYQMMWKREEKPAVVGEFIPTNEWQEVLPGQAVPKV